MACRLSQGRHRPPWWRLRGSCGTRSIAGRVVAVTPDAVARSNPWLPPSSVPRPSSRRVIWPQRISAPSLTASFATVATPRNPGTTDVPTRDCEPQHTHDAHHSQSEGFRAGPYPRHPIYQYPLDVLQQLDMDPDALHHLASQRPTPLSLSSMYHYAASTVPSQRVRNAQFLHRELAIRVAQRAVDLLTLPLGLSDAEPIRQVARLYLHYVKQLQEAPMPTNENMERGFTKLLQSFVLDRSTIPTQIARGVREWNQHCVALQQQQQQQQQPHNDTTQPTASRHSRHGTNSQPPWQERQDILEEALYRFFTARVGLRFLIEHHVVSAATTDLDDRNLLTSVFPALDGTEDGTDAPQEMTSGNHIDSNVVAAGCIQSNLDVVQETRRVADLVRAQTERLYGDCPEIQIVDCIHATASTHARVNTHQPRHTTGFTYVPHHLHYMLAELLLNACHATVRRYRHQGGILSTERSAVTDPARRATNAMAPVRVVLVMGGEDITIKVCDKGGGIPRSLMSKIWKFGHSTDTSDDSLACAEEVAGARIRGFGLPLARIYARYFGGELSLKSLEGHGVDAYLHLPRLGEACENLPLRVRSSPGEGDSTPQHYW